MVEFETSLSAAELDTIQGCRFQGLDLQNCSDLHRISKGITLVLNLLDLTT